MARKNTMTSMLEPMKVGESKDFPAEKIFSVQTMASMLGFKWKRRYSTSIDRERRVVTVTRIE